MSASPLAAGEIILALEALNTLLGLISRQVAQARERGELTAEEEYKLDLAISELTSKDYWQTSGD
jgi:hypothetical protein